MAIEMEGNSFVLYKRTSKDGAERPVFGILGRRAFEERTSVVDAYYREVLAENKDLNVLHKMKELAMGASE